MYDACRENPELVWQAISEILKQPLSQAQEAQLAAGPLENLLTFAGAHFIDRIEQEAHENPKFQRLLGGVWKHLMPEEIWQRIESLKQPEPMPV